MSKHSMASGHNHVVIYEYVCDKCGLKMYISRKKCATKREGNKRTLYCVRCNKKTKFTQGDII